MNYNMLKKLTIISLFILALPFFQTCSDKSIMSNSFLKNSPLLEPARTVTDSVNGKEIDYSNEKEYNYTSKELADKKRETVNKFLIVKNDMTYNGYQLGFLFIVGLDSHDFFNSIDYGFLPFFLTLIITVLLIYFAFKSEAKTVLILSIVNVLFLILQLIICYYSDLLEDSNQIKFGYYLFTINLVLIALEAYKIQRIAKTNT